MTAQHHSNEASTRESASVRISSERDPRLGHVSSLNASKYVAPWWPLLRDVLSGYVLSGSVIYEGAAGDESAVQMLPRLAT